MKNTKTLKLQKKLKKLVSFSVLLSIFLLFFSAPLNAYTKNDKLYSESVGSTLFKIFTPDYLKIIINGDNVWVEVKGANMNNVRIENIKFKALLKNKNSKITKDNQNISIKKAEGKLVLLEKDVNSYFANGASSSGFSNLLFDFTKKGFKAKGDYTADFLFGLTINLEAIGQLQLKKDGVYFENTSFYTEGIKQPDQISEIILNKINPLLDFSDIPFDITFKELKMDDNSVVLSSNPKELTKGAVWEKRKIVK